MVVQPYRHYCHSRNLSGGRISVTNSRRTVRYVAQLVRSACARIEAKKKLPVLDAPVNFLHVARFNARHDARKSYDVAARDKSLPSLKPTATMSSTGGERPVHLEDPGGRAEEVQLTTNSSRSTSKIAT